MRRFCGKPQSLVTLEPGRRGQLLPCVGNFVTVAFSLPVPAGRAAATKLVWIFSRNLSLVMGTGPKFTNRIKSNLPGFESSRIESVIESK